MTNSTMVLLFQPAGEDVFGYVSCLTAQFRYGNRFVKRSHSGATQRLEAMDWFTSLVEYSSFLIGICSHSQRIRCEKVAFHQMVDQRIVELAIIRLRASAAENLPYYDGPFLLRSPGSIGHLDLVFYRTKVQNVSAVTNESVLRLKPLFYGQYLRSATVPMDVPETAQAPQKSLLF